MSIFHHKVRSKPAAPPQEMPSPRPVAPPSPERACGGCGVTATALERRWEEAERRGVIVLGPPTMMYCFICDKVFCPSCQVDLGLTAGCPIHKIELM